MIQITKEQFDSIPTDYRGVWSREDHPELVGKKTALENSLLGVAGLPMKDGACALVIEGISFEIIEEKKTIEPTPRITNSINYNTEWEEYKVVVRVLDGKQVVLKRASYYTGDKEDAQGTEKLMIEEMETWIAKNNQ
ncbi:MAG: hypothetical protein JEZ12_13165 [Desulfobacterium sp.]|nr:hypothetical protein [Desulfobacterium sp.]